MNHIVLLTFDYELFLGESGTVENCLIKPTNLLLEVLNQNNAHGTFFIDVTFLLRLIEVGNSRQFSLIKAQIQDMVRGGHEIGLHIHPHWVDAEYQEDGETWIFKDFTKYKISNCPQIILTELFDKGTALLNKIAQEVVPGYEVKSFRAGGWCADPFTSISEHLRRNGIFIDASVIPYRRLAGNTISSFDYSDIRASKPYRFSNNLHEEENDGVFIEIPLSTYKVSPFVQFKSLFKRRFSNSTSTMKRFGDGKSVFDVESNTDFHRYTKYFTWTRSYYSCDSCSELMINRIKNEDQELITIVSHPKCLSIESLSIISKIVSMRDNQHMSIIDYLSSF